MKAIQGCPGAAAMDFRCGGASGDGDAAREAREETVGTLERRESQLRQWPVQLHLVSPDAPCYQDADVVLAADCVAYALADFHEDYLKGHALAIACPKLDQGTDVYVEKLARLIDGAKINSLTVMIMQVPCCRGLFAIAQRAVEKAERQVPVKAIVVGVQGEILAEQWL